MQIIKCLTIYILELNSWKKREFIAQKRGDFAQIRIVFVIKCSNQIARLVWNYDFPCLFEFSKDNLLQNYTDNQIYSYSSSGWKLWSLLYGTEKEGGDSQEKRGPRGN